MGSKSTIATDGARILTIYAVRNPEKLKAMQAAEEWTNELKPNSRRGD